MFLKYATTLVPAYTFLFLTSLYLKHVLQKTVCSPWTMSDYITNLETNSTYWPVAQKNKDYFICVPEIRLYIFLLLINKKLDAKSLNCRLTRNRSNTKCAKNLFAELMCCTNTLLLDRVREA